MNLELIENILLILLVLVSLALVALVLLQQGRGANAGAAFGGGGANTVFGSVGPANFLQRLTTWLAVFFFVITFGLAYIAKEQATGVDESLLPEAVDGAAPAVTAPAGDLSDVPFEGMVPLDVPSVGDPDAPTLEGDDRDEVPEVPPEDAGADLPG